MATLNGTYQYIGRSNAVGSPAGWKYYILLYARTSGDISTGKHSVTVLQRLACDVNSSFYGYSTTGSVTVGGESAFSWSWAPVPGAAWNTSNITEGGYTYPRWIDLKEGTVVVNTGYGVAKDVVISSSWVMKESYSATWFPYTGTEAKASVTVTLPMIASASAITSAPNIVLGNKCSVAWTPQAASFRYKLKFSMGSWSYTTGVIHPNQTSAYTYTGYTIPLSVASQIPNKPSGTMTATLYTYSDSGATKQIGSADSETFTVTVPDNTDTKPVITMTLAPVSSLGSAFSGLYIQGKTKVKATLSAQGKYGASVGSYSMEVAGEKYDSDDSYTSSYLTRYGDVTVSAYAVDSRGYTGSATGSISVIAYSQPKILNVAVERCDKNNNTSDSGTYLRIKAKRSYSKVVSGGVQKNFCKIQYRYKADGGSYSSWVTILASNSLSTDEVITAPLLDGKILASSSYQVQVQAIDDLGEKGITTVVVPSDLVYMHKNGPLNSLGLGKYVSIENLLDIGWQTRHAGGFMAIEIADGADFNALTIPNVYVGLYASTSSYQNSPISNGTFVIEVIPIGWSGQRLQRLTHCTDYATVYERQYYSGTWHAWECVNPPMLIGVEYRTKERYLGEPVYTMVLDCETLPAAAGNKLVKHNADVAQVLRCTGQMSDGNCLPFHYAANNWVEIHAGPTYVTIRVGDDKSKFTAKAQIWYTKN